MMDEKWEVDARRKQQMAGRGAWSEYKGVARLLLNRRIFPMWPHEVSVCVGAPALFAVLGCSLCCVSARDCLSVCLSVYSSRMQGDP